MCSYLIPSYNSIGAFNDLAKVGGQGQMSKHLSKLNYGPYPKYYFTHILHTWHQGTTQLGAFNDVDEAQGHKSRSNCSKIYFKK